MSQNIHKTTIIIPALNEAHSIGDVITVVKDYGLPLVVDDGSNDGTGEIAAKAGAHVVKNKRNCGYDEALNTGFAEAVKCECKFAVTIDADGQHDPSLLQKFIYLLRQGNRLVVGYRPKKARFAEYAFAWYTWLRFGIRDPLCGMKGYDIGLYHELGYFDSYNSIGTELMLYGLRQKVQYAIVKVPIRPREGKPRFGQVIQSNMRILTALYKSILRYR